MFSSKEVLNSLSNSLTNSSKTSGFKVSTKPITMMSMPKSRPIMPQTKPPIATLFSFLLGDCALEIKAKTMARIPATIPTQPPQQHSTRLAIPEMSDMIEKASLPGLSGIRIGRTGG